MAYNQDNVWSEDVPTNNTQQQPQQAPAPAPQNNNGWDTNAFKQVVGRDPDQKETDYYSNAGSGWLDEVKRNTPGYSTPAPQQAPTTTGGGQPPSYYNASDPVHQAVWQAYQAKGIQPRDASDFNYWVQHINDSGGLANGYQSTGGTGTWADRMASANGGVGDYRTGGAPIAGGTRGGGGFYSPGQRDPRLDSLYDELVKRSQQSLEVNPNDPVLKAQTTAFRNAQTRGLRSNLAQTAEAAGPNANLSAETRAAGETAAQNTAGFQAELQGREVDARRKEIADALAGRMGMLSMDQQAQLRREDMALQSRQIDLQGQRDENDAANAAWDRQYKTLFGA